MTTVQRARRADARANREAILRAASELLRIDPDASIDQIAEAAGLSRRSIYGHFDSRDELLTQLVSQGAARITEAMAGIHDDDPARELALTGAALWTQVADVKLAARMAVTSALSGAVAWGLADVRAALRDTAMRGIRSGVFRDDHDPDMLARLIERVAIDVLDEAVERELSDGEAQRLVVVAALGVAGLGWRDADAVADTIFTEETR
ncbi:MAG: TetR/AcrR family transcriptional regulator [Microbacterium sp.]